MKKRQLDLFKPTDQRIEDAAFELHNMIYAMKSYAYSLEMNLGDSHPAFLSTKQLAIELSELSALLSPMTERYFKLTPQDWQRKSLYNPFYSSLEPRSPYDLYLTALDYESRLKRLILRLEAICFSDHVLAKEKITQILDTARQIVKSLFKEKYLCEI